MNTLRVEPSIRYNKGKKKMLVIHDMLKRSFLWTRERNIRRCRVRRKLRRRNRMPYAKKEIQAGEELEVRGERLAEFVDDVAILSLLPTLSGNGASDGAETSLSGSRARAQRAIYVKHSSSDNGG